MQLSRKARNTKSNRHKPTMNKRRKTKRRSKMTRTTSKAMVMQRKRKAHGSKRMKGIQPRHERRSASTHRMARFHYRGGASFVDSIFQIVRAIFIQEMEINLTIDDNQSVLDNLISSLENDFQTHSYMRGCSVRESAIIMNKLYDLEKRIFNALKFDTKKKCSSG